MSRALVLATLATTRTTGGSKSWAVWVRRPSDPRISGDDQPHCSPLTFAVTTVDIDGAVLYEVRSGPAGDDGVVSAHGHSRPFDARTGHLANPCTAVGPPAILATIGPVDGGEHAAVRERVA